MRKFTSALLLATTLLASFAAFATDDKKPTVTPDVVVNVTEDATTVEKTDEPSKDQK